MKKDMKGRKKRSPVWRLLEAAFLVVFLVVLVLMVQRLSLAVRRYDEQKAATDMMRYLLESVGVAPTPTPTPTPEPTPTPIPITFTESVDLPLPNQNTQIQKGRPFWIDGTASIGLPVLTYDPIS